MRKLCFLLLAPLFCFADPGVTIEIDLFIEKPSGPGETFIGCK